jgi:predicted trehalose synthase
MLRLVQELVTVTDRLIAETENDRFDTVGELTGERETMVNRLDKLHTEVPRPAGTPAGSEEEQKELRAAIAQLNERSSLLNRTILAKSESLVSTIRALNKNRFYGST